jgi:hypothetical protein
MNFFERISANAVPILIILLAAATLFGIYAH